MLALLNGIGRKVGSMKTLQPGSEVFNLTSGEVMTFTHKHYEFSIRFGIPCTNVYACGYDDFKRIVIWPFSQVERV